MKYLYLWKELDNITVRWHSKAGLVIVAESPVRALEMLDEWRKLEFGVERKGYHSDKYEYIDELPGPDNIWLVGDVEEFIRVFPDAGCC